ncbi:MAG: DegV family protein [Anaerolineales bacterium]|nr:DegV family protein [Anaerolineales bacterium]
MNIRIVTDSTCDLPPEILERENITVIPLYINFGEKSFRDGVDISRKDFYEMLPDAPVHPTTSVPGIGVFVKAYQKLVTQGADQILSIHISSQLSNAVNVASLAAEAIEQVKVTVIDACQLTVGTGLQVLEAANAVRQGKTIQEIVHYLEMFRKRIGTFAALDTLEFLRRSGRLSNFQAALGSLLDLKPLLSMHNNVINMEKARTRQRAMNWLLKTFSTLTPVEQIIMVHTAAMDRARALWDQLKEIAPDIPEPLFLDVTPVLGSHLGPGVVGFTTVSAAPSISD